MVGTNSLPRTSPCDVTSAAFADDRTLFYTVEDKISKRSHRVYRHRIGDAAQADVVVHDETDERFEVEVDRTRSDKFIVVSIESHTTSEARFVPADRPTEPLKALIPRKPEQEYTIDHQGDRFVMRINDTGRNFRLVAVPLEDWSTASWQELLPHRDSVMIEALDCFQGHVVVTETGSPKDHPGTWTGYVVHEGGIRQVVRRVARPDVIRWTERSRRAAGGAWGVWSPGRLTDRCWDLPWPTGG